MASRAPKTEFPQFLSNNFIEIHQNLPFLSKKNLIWLIILTKLPAGHIHDQIFLLAKFDADRAINLALENKKLEDEQGYFSNVANMVGTGLQTVNSTRRRMIGGEGLGNSLQGGGDSSWEVSDSHRFAKSCWVLDGYVFLHEVIM